jgi:hypothetical protein
VKETKAIQFFIASLATIIGGIALPESAAAEDLQGFAKGFITSTIGLTQNGAPLLQSYYFRFTDKDHHFGGIEVRPNIPAINKASLGYSDKNGDDKYSYKVTFAPYFGEIIRRTTTEFGKKGSFTFAVKRPDNPANYVFVIRGFYLQYRGGDHHIEEFGIEENGGQVTVTLNDKNNDDPFRIDLDYAFIPKQRFSEINVRSGRNAKGGQRASIGSGVGVIRGFRFKFTNGDHHIKESGIVMNGAGRLEVYFSDKNQDDPFNWNVRYGIVKPQ